MNMNKIAVVDDDEDDRAFLTEAVMSVCQSDILIAANGKELIESLCTIDFVPTLMFLDLNMPLMDGHECLEELKKVQRLRDMIVIIYTTSSNPGHVERTYNCGANLYVTKPMQYADIGKIVTTISELDEDTYRPQPMREKYVLLY